MVYLATWRDLPWHDKSSITFDCLIPDIFPKPFYKVMVGAYTPYASKPYVYLFAQMMEHNLAIEEPLELRALRRGILHFLRSSEYPSFAPSEMHIIEHGFGRFAPGGESIEISDPLILSTLLDYLYNSSTGVGISLRTSNLFFAGHSLEEAAGCGFEDALVQDFCNVFSGERARPLNDLLHIHNPGHSSKFTMDWGRFSARVITDWANEAAISEPRRTRRLATKARNPEETLSWFSSPDRTPFLLPDEHFGADIVFAVQLQKPSRFSFIDDTDPDDARFDKKLLLISISTKAWREASDGAAFADALFRASPEGFFSTLVSHPSWVHTSTSR